MNTNLIPNVCPHKSFKKTLTFLLSYKLQDVEVDKLSRMQRLSVTLEHKSLSAKTIKNKTKKTIKKQVGRKPKAIPMRYCEKSGSVMRGGNEETDTSSTSSSSCQSKDEHCENCGSVNSFELTNSDLVCVECGVCSKSDAILLRNPEGRSTLYSTNGTRQNTVEEVTEDFDKIFKDNACQDYCTSTHFKNVFLWSIGDIKKNDTYKIILQEIKAVLVAPVSLCDVQHLLKKSKYPQTYRRYATLVYHELNGIERPVYKKRMLYDLISVHEMFALECYKKYENNAERKYLLPYQAQIHFILQYLKEHKLAQYFPLPYHINTLVLLRETIDILKKCICEVFEERTIKFE
jgi:glutaredoxin